MCINIHANIHKYTSKKYHTTQNNATLIKVIIPSLVYLNILHNNMIQSTQTQTILTIVTQVSHVYHITYYNYTIITQVNTH